MPDGPAAIPPGPSAPPPGERLDSWKEIAAYLDREVRTVQRWEKKEGLPVHRHVHDKQGTVYAFKSELEAWRNSRRPGFDEEPELPPDPEVDAGEDSQPEQLQHEENQAPQPAPRPHPVRRSLAPWLLLALLAIAVAGGWIIHRLIAPAAKPRAGKVMLAVLPFDNLSSDPRQDYFSDGFTEEMISQLGRMEPERLGVIARTTMMQYKGTHKSVEDIGGELKVDYILEGSVRRSADKVRITAQLIQVSDQTHRWAENYDRDLRDILAVQSNVASAIASQIRTELSVPSETSSPASLGPPGGARQVDPDAYEAYLRGRFYWNQRIPDALRKSVDYFNQAIAKDPNYALAYTGLADAYNLLGATPNDVLPPVVARAKMKAAAQKAIALDDSLSEAHASLADVTYHFDWDWSTADKEFRRAISLNPSNANAHHWYGQFLCAIGQPKQALDEATLARQLDPYDPLLNISLAEVHYYARDFDRAVQQSQKVLELHPNFFLAHFWLGAAYREKKMYPEALAEFERARTLSGNSPAMIMALGHTYALAGNRNEAQKALGELKDLSKTRYVPAMYFAAIHVGLGERDQAFTWLDMARQERTDRLVYLNAEPMADPLRSDPRFPPFIARTGLSAQPR